MGHLGLFYSINFSNRHFEINSNYDTIRSTLKTPCIRTQSNNDSYTDSNARRQKYEPDGGRREPPGRTGGGSGGARGGGRGRGRGREFAQGQETQRSSPPPPKYDMIVVVEGVNDMKAVRKTLNADVSKDPENLF